MKIQVIILSVFVTAAYGSPLNSKTAFTDGRIVGGLPIEIDLAPHQISLQDRGFHICGGSLISPNFVLTAAHCTNGNNAKNFQIRAGSSLYREGGITVQVEKIIQHENFNYNDIDYDFSLLKLEKSLDYSDKIQPISLPEQDESVDDDTLCFVTGWGTTQNTQESREQLRAAYVPSVNQQECAKAYNNINEITNQMICAGFRKGQVDACQGDSGGPLVASKKLIGVVSWGYSCALPDYPGVYSRVASVRNWIDSAMTEDDTFFE